jgi:hypothetical protein
LALIFLLSLLPVHYTDYLFLKLLADLFVAPSKRTSLGCGTSEYSTTEMPFN